MELCSMLWGSVDGRGVWGRMDTCICMAECLCCSPETITTLLICYTPIQNGKCKWKKNTKVYRWFFFQLANSMSWRHVITDLFFQITQLSHQQSWTQERKFLWMCSAERNVLLAFLTEDGRHNAKQILPLG